MSATHGVDEDVEDPQLRSVLTAPLRIRWAFERGLVPGNMEPPRVTFGMWSRTLSDEPVVDLGDVIAVDVRLGVSGPYLYRFEGGRVTDAPTELVPGQPWAARTTVEVADFLADLGSRFPVYGPEYGGLAWGSLDIWQTRFAMVGRVIGRSIGLPSGLATVSAAAPLLRARWFGDSAAAITSRLLRSWAPGGIHHVLVTRHTPGSTAYPPGYVWADPTDRPIGGGGIPTTPYVPDPVTTTRHLVVPASRQETTAFGSPLQFVVRSNMVTVANTPGAVAPRRHPALSASWCRIPATLTRRRDHLINTVRIKGVHQSTQSFGTENYDKTGQTEVANLSDVAARGSIARDIDTDLVIREYATNDSETGPIRPGVVEQGNYHLSDPSVLASNKAYGALEVYAHLMPADEAAAVLPYLAPQPPGLGDGRILRHVSVYALDPAVVDPAATPGGFIAAGELVIERGRLRYVLSTTPGAPGYGGASPSPITLGQFTAKTFAPTYAVANLDPTLRVGDLSQIGA